MPQSLSRLLVHLVFSTRNREPCLTSHIQAELYAYLAATLQNMGCIPLQVGGAKDHVHLLFALSRTKTVAEVVEALKVGSSKWLKTKGPELARFHWQSGYGAFSVSESDCARVIAYIKDQERRHARFSFQEEYRKLLSRHRINFDEQYVWD